MSDKAKDNNEQPSLGESSGKQDWYRAGALIAAGINIGPGFISPASNAGATVGGINLNGAPLTGIPGPACGSAIPSNDEETEPRQAGGDEESQEQQEQGKGSYTNTHKSGKTYDGKGGKDRMRRSANSIANEKKDPVVTQQHNPAVDDKQSFIDEQNNIEAHGGPGGNTYNKINSPGKKLRDGK